MQIGTKAKNIPDAGFGSWTWTGNECVSQLKRYEIDLLGMVGFAGNEIDGE
jgi:hypothetical protein